MTKYGRRELTVCSIAFVAMAAAVLLLVRPFWIGALAAVPPVVAWLWVLWFFRDPHRQTPTGDGLIIAPADGKVTDVTPLGEGSLLGQAGVQVGIFMSVFDVHVNTAPATAVVDKIEHRKGTFLDVRAAEAWEKNESATIYLWCEHGGKKLPMVVRQIAGLIARRIVTDLSPGKSIARGERIGMIKFGSRLEVLVPSELVGEVRVRVGQHVRAGSTILISGPETQTP